MTGSLFAKPKECEPAETTPPCWIFAWIGQSAQSCDECGEPISKHLYHPPYGGAKPLFRVKQWDRYRGWHWAEVGSLIRGDQ